MKIENHPAVIKFRTIKKKEKPNIISASLIKKFLKDSGANKAGIVDIHAKNLAKEKQAVLAAFPNAKTFISFFVDFNTSNLRSTDRSLADIEYTNKYERINEIAFKASEFLQKKGIASITPSAAFPQKTDVWPNRMHTVSHKLIAQEAGLGKIGINRLIINEEYGSNIGLGTIVIDVKADIYDSPMDYNPCIECGLCAIVCPTGAISKNKEFNSLSCLVNVYRNRIGGFISFIESLVDSQNMDEFRKKRQDSETLSVWQSLTTGGGYRCSYCMSVCPAGNQNLEYFLDHRKDYLNNIVKPLMERQENVYVFKGSDSEERVKSKFKSKTAKYI